MKDWYIVSQITIPDQLPVFQIAQDKSFGAAPLRLRFLTCTL